MPTTTDETIRASAALILDNDHALYNERRRRVIAAAAGEPDAELRDSVAGRALRAWLRDDLMPRVIESATGRLRMDFRDERAKAEAAGENVAGVGWRSWNDSTLNGAQMLAGDLLACAVEALDWQRMAAEVLDGDEGGASIRAAVDVLAKLRELYPNADEVIGEVPAPALAEACGIDSAELAPLLAVLEDLQLSGSRYVGGVSGTLVHPRR